MKEITILRDGLNNTILVTLIIKNYELSVKSGKLIVMFIMQKLTNLKENW